MNQEHKGAIENIDTNTNGEIFENLRQGLQRSFANTGDVEYLSYGNKLNPVFSPTQILGADTDKESLAFQKYKERGQRSLVLGFGEHRVHISADENAVGDLGNQEWLISDIKVDGNKSLYLRFDFRGVGHVNDGKIELTERTNPEIMRELFRLMLGDTMDDTVEDIVLDHDILLSDYYDRLPQLITDIITEQPTVVVEGRLSSIREIAQSIDYMRRIREFDGVYEVGVSKTEYRVVADTRFSTGENPEGYYLTRSNNVSTENIVFVPYRNNAGEVVGYLQHSMLETRLGETPRTQVAINSGVETGVSLQRYVNNDLVRSARQRRLVHNLKTQLETVYSGFDDEIDTTYLTPDLNAIESKYDREDIFNELMVEYELLRIRQDFRILANSLKDQLYGPVEYEQGGKNNNTAHNLYDHRPYLQTFVGDYLALKIYMGQMTEDEVRAKIQQGSFTWFSDLQNTLKYIIRMGGHRRIRFEG